MIKILIHQEEYWKFLAGVLCSRRVSIHDRSRVGLSNSDPLVLLFTNVVESIRALSVSCSFKTPTDANLDRQARKQFRKARDFGK